MGIEIKIVPAPAFVVGSSAQRTDARRVRIDDMKASLVEMYGTAAIAIARSQPEERDVGGRSGITWHEVAQAFLPG